MFPTLPATSTGAAMRLGLAALLLSAATSTFGAPNCDFKAGQPASASFGAIDPQLATNATFNVTLQIKCTGGGSSIFSIAGLHDTGPGAYRLQHISVPTEFMAYTVSTAVVVDTSITLTGTIVSTTYQNAYFGSYSDSLTVTVTP